MAPNPSQPRAVRRAGFLAAAVVNLLLLWVANQLLEWAWPPFLTSEYDDLLPWINASLGATAVANLAWVGRDPAWFRQLGELGLNLISVAVAIQSWQLFPFDFSTYSRVWEVAARVLIGIAGIGAAIGAAAALGRLARLAGLA